MSKEYLDTDGTLDLWNRMKTYVNTHGGGGGGGPSFDQIYPIGSIYMSVNSTNPGTLFGGTWQEIPGRFLVGAGDNNASGNEALNLAAGATGGEKDHLLTGDESGNPELTHSVTQAKYTLADHTHRTANSMIVYNNASANSARMATSGSGTKISLNSTYATQQSTHNLDTYGANTTPVMSPSTNASVTKHSKADASDAHNNMPPYLAVYIWKRTA